MKTNLRIIGDIHGHYEQYHQLLRKAHDTLQIGDFGFDYKTLINVNSNRHRIIGGNHDNYDKVELCPNFLGDYGIHTVDEFGDIFFVRGALSIDRSLRIEGISWWQAEELTMAQCHRAIEAYKQAKPNFVVTHTCPVSVVPYVTQSMNIRKSRTSQMLEEMFSIHQPSMWIFGHFHISWQKTLNNTHFVCLKELECLDF